MRVINHPIAFPGLAIISVLITTQIYKKTLNLNLDALAIHVWTPYLRIARG